MRWCIFGLGKVLGLNSPERGFERRGLAEILLET
jgi:hypothetical protein